MAKNLQITQRYKSNKKVKTNVERESIFIIKSHQTGPQFKKNYLH